MTSPNHQDAVHHVRFLHTSDLQIGKTLAYLGGEGQARFNQARLDAIEALGKVAVDQQCSFIVIAGDVFEKNRLSAKVLNRAKEALRKLKLPVYLLPGNHDPLTADSIFYKTEDLENIHVISDSQPIEISQDVELIGAPLRSIRAPHDLVNEVLEDLEPTDTIRIMAGHGPTQSFGEDSPERIDMVKVSEALDRGVIDYLALGDTHSTQPVEAKKRAWYSGAPEVTDFHNKCGGRDGGENNSGNVLVVDIYKNDATDAVVEVQEIPVGTWTFEEIDANLTTAHDVDAFIKRLDNYPEKALTVIRYSLQGSLPIAEYARLQGKIEELESTFASLHVHKRYHNLRIAPSEEEISQLELGAVAQAAVKELQELADTDAAESEAARDALNLLFRLSSSSEGH